MAKLLGRENFLKKGIFRIFCGANGVAKIAFLSHFLPMGGPRFCLDSEWEGAESELRGGGDHPPPIGFRGNRLCPPPILAEKGLKRGTFAAPKAP